MASAKPVIHGRDHLPGGADEIPGLDVLGAGFNSAEEILVVSEVTLTDDEHLEVDWSHYDGPALLDRTVQNQPVVVTNGVYTFDVGFQWFGNLADGMYFSVTLQIVTALTAYPPSYLYDTSVMPNAGAADVSVATVTGTISRTARMLAGDGVLIRASNFDSLDHDFQALISCTRILQF